MIENQKQFLSTDIINNKNNINFDDNSEINDIIIYKVNSKINKCFNKKKLFYLTFLGRIIMTIYSFYALFFIFNIIIQYIILIPGIISNIQNNIVQIILDIINFIFGIYISNILIIPIYEFFSFPFLRYYNPFAHLESFLQIIDIIGERRNIKDKSN